MNDFLIEIVNGKEYNILIKPQNHKDGKTLYKHCIIYIKELKENYTWFYFEKTLNEFIHDIVM